MHPGDNSSDRVITSIIDILYSMMEQVCEGLRFDLPFFLPDVQNTEQHNVLLRDIKIDIYKISTLSIGGISSLSSKLEY